MKTIGELMAEDERQTLRARIDAWHLAFSGRAIMPTPPKVPGRPAFLDRLGSYTAARFRLEPYQDEHGAWRVTAYRTWLGQEEPVAVLAEGLSADKGHAIFGALTASLSGALALAYPEKCSTCTALAAGLVGGVLLCEGHIDAELRPRSAT